MKNAFNSNLPKPNPKLRSAVSAMSSPPPGQDTEEGPVAALRHSPAPSAEAEKPAATSRPAVKQTRTRPVSFPREWPRDRYSMASELETHLQLAMQARSRHGAELEEARSVLARTANAAADALHQLASVEKRIQDRTQALKSLLSELDELKHSRADALGLARRLSRLDRGLA